MPSNTLDEIIKELYLKTSQNFEIRATAFKDIQDKAIIIGFMEQYGDSYPTMLGDAASLQDDKAVVMSIVTRWPSQLKHASEQLKKDPEVQKLAEESLQKKLNDGLNQSMLPGGNSSFFTSPKAPMAPPPTPPPPTPPPPKKQAPPLPPRGIKPSGKGN